MQSATSRPDIVTNGHLVRRLLDVAGALSGLVLLSPLLVVTALLVRASSPGPALHRAVRVGQGGRLFHLYKFRSMVTEANQIGPGITPAADRRITPLGAWLRRLKIDELPQLINVLKGEMSLVGPRPEDPRYVAHYTPEQRLVLTVQPGLTSRASLRYRSEAELLTGPNWEKVYLIAVLPDKLRIDLDYLQNRTLFTDLRVIFETILTLFR